jgi:hypothetical protein
VIVGVIFLDELLPQPNGISSIPRTQLRVDSANVCFQSVRRYEEAFCNFLVGVPCNQLLKHSGFAGGEGDFWSWTIFLFICVLENALKIQSEGV